MESNVYNDDHLVNIALKTFKIDRLSWLLAGFVMALGFIIQKFSMRYLLGDHHKAKRHYKAS
jgi:NADH:ubiquinone oxidoreductase subunit 5 (subunit L)/multisubunit Na+/H+ antiporter MnhA subunit